MIQVEHPVIMDDGSENAGLIKHWSDSGLLMRQVETGDTYGEAIDLYPCMYTYEETDIPIEPQADATEEDYLEALKRMGVEA